MGAPVDGASTEATAQAAQPSIILTSIRWGSNEIPVCFVNASDANLATRTRVRALVEQEYGTRTRIRFTGWGACAAFDSAAPASIRISIGTVWPQSQVGPVKAATTMHLYAWDAPGNANTGGGWRGTVLHEFGHAVGLPHEQDRLDSVCRDSVGASASSSTLYGPYDPDSLMNYCNPTLTSLSRGDLLALEWLFGTPGQYRTEGDATWRYTRPDATNTRGTRCRVVSTEQLEAFGGAGLVGGADGVAWMHTVDFGASVLWGRAYSGACTTTFDTRNNPNATLTQRAAIAGTLLATGDFDGDGTTDVALAGGGTVVDYARYGSWIPMPRPIMIGFSNGDGTFRTVEASPGSFPRLANQAGAKLLAGRLRRRRRRRPRARRGLGAGRPSRSSAPTVTGASSSTARAPRSSPTTPRSPACRRSPVNSTATAPATSRSRATRTGPRSPSPSAA